MKAILNSGKNKDIGVGKRSFGLIIGVFFVMSIVPNSGFSQGSFFSSLSSMQEDTDLYDAYRNKDKRVPAFVITNLQIYHIAERVVSSGYNYFAFSKKAVKNDGIFSMVDLQNTEFFVLERDENTFPSEMFVWNAKEVCREGRQRSGYTDQQREKLHNANVILEKDPENLNALGQKAQYFSDKARYEGEGLQEYYDALKEFIKTKQKQGQRLNPNGELGYFMDVAICLKKENEYLSLINSMPGDDPSKVTSRKQYDFFLEELRRSDARKTRCRKYD